MNEMYFEGVNPPDHKIVIEEIEQLKKARTTYLENLFDIKKDSKEGSQFSSVSKGYSVFSSTFTSLIYDNNFRHRI